MTSNSLVASAENCQALLSSSQLAAYGTDAQCYQDSDQSILIVLGEGPTINVNHQISLQPLVIR